MSEGHTHIDQRILDLLQPESLYMRDLHTILEGQWDDLVTSLTRLQRAGKVKLRYDESVNDSLCSRTLGLDVKRA